LRAAIRPSSAAHRQVLLRSSASGHGHRSASIPPRTRAAPTPPRARAGWRHRARFDPHRPRTQARVRPPALRGPLSPSPVVGSTLHNGGHTTGARRTGRGRHVWKRKNTQTPPLRCRAFICWRRPQIRRSCCRSASSQWYSCFLRSTRGIGAVYAFACNNPRLWRLVESEAKAIVLLKNNDCIKACPLGDLDENRNTYVGVFSDWLSVGGGCAWVEKGPIPDEVWNCFPRRR